MDELTLLLNGEPRSKNQEPSKKSTLHLSAWFSGHKTKLTKKELRIFTTTLGRLLAGGVPLLQAFEILTRQAQKKSFKKMIFKIEEKIRGGENLSKALEDTSSGLKPYYLQMIKIGEASGKLEEVLNALSLYLEKEDERNRKVKEALAYPLFILVSGIATLFVLMKVVLPKIVYVYDGFEGSLPLITQWTLKISEYFVPTMFISAGCIAGLIIFLRTKWGWGALGLLNRIPLIGTLIQKQLLVQFSSMLALLLQSGVPILQSLSILAASLDDKKDTERIQKAKTLIAQGESIYGTFKKEILWMRDEELALINAGEESGRLPESLDQIASESEKELTAYLQIMLKLLEPCLILGVGLIVSFIVISALLPIFDMNTLLR